MASCEASTLAVSRGLDFLGDVVGPDGAWPCPRYGDTALTGQPDPEYPPFAAGVAALALNACDDPRARALHARTAAYLTGTARYPGVWRYWPTIPPDMDDTAICSLVAIAHPWVLLGRNVALILANRDGEGRFLTWMLPKKFAHEIGNEVDAVVNANMVAYLGDCPETQAAQRWVGTVVMQGREAESTPNYCDEMDLYFAIARAASLAGPSFSLLRPFIADRIRERLAEGSGRGGVMHVAQALSALDMLGLRERAAESGPALDRLLDSQLPNGAWPKCLAWQNPNPPYGGFGSEALTTAFCIEALARWNAPGPDPSGCG